MKEGFIMGAGISAFIMAVWFFISSLFPSPTVEYLQNEYHTNDIEIVWESKVDSGYCALSDLIDLQLEFLETEDTNKLDSLVTNLITIESNMKNQNTNFNCTR